MKRFFGYALAGVSGFGEYCVEQYRRIDSLKPVAVWNRTAAKAARFAEKHGMRHYESLEEMLADPAVDVVHVAGVPSLHAEHSRLALEAGKHVLCEKPLAVNLEDGRALVELAAARGLRLAVNFVMRYGPFWETARDVAREQLLGAPLRAEVTNCAGDSGLPEDHWFWDESLSGGIFVEHGVHFFDLVRSWMAPEETGVVTGATRLKRPGAKMIDQARCSVRYGEQTTAEFYHGFHQFDALDRQHCRLVFERGEILLAGWVAGSLRLRAVLPAPQRERLQSLLPRAEFKSFRGDFTGPRRRRGLEETVDAALECELTDPRDSQQLYGDAIRDLMEDFLRGVRDPSHRPRVTAEDALAALEPAVQARSLAFA